MAWIRDRQIAKLEMNTTCIICAAQSTSLNQPFVFGQDWKLAHTLEAVHKHKLHFFFRSSTAQMRNLWLTRLGEAQEDVVFAFLGEEEFYRRKLYLTARHFWKVAMRIKSFPQHTCHIKEDDPQGWISRIFRRRLYNHLVISTRRQLIRAIRVGVPAWVTRVTWLFSPSREFNSTYSFTNLLKNAPNITTIHLPATSWDHIASTMFPWQEKVIYTIGHHVTSSLGDPHNWVIKCAFPDCTQSFPYSRRRNVFLCCYLAGRSGQAACDAHMHVLHPHLAKRPTNHFPPTCVQCTFHL